jgi:hypothetical protein
MSRLVADTTPAADLLQQALILVRDGRIAEVTDAAILKEMKERKMMKQDIRKAFGISQGPKFARVRTKPETDLTLDLLKRCVFWISAIACVSRKVNPLI